MRHEKQTSALRIASIYIGTIVGAGFASGQEVLQFFGFYGLRGLLGVALASMLFGFFGHTILKLGNKLNASSHQEVIRHVAGRWLGGAIDVIITFFLFGALAVMAAGAAAIFEQQFGLPAILGSAVMILATMVTVFLGVERVFDSISYVVPLLLIAVFSMAVLSVVYYPEAFTANINWSQPFKAPSNFWPFTALLYVSYNLVVAVAVLAPLGSLSPVKNLRTGSILGALGLGLGIMAIIIAMLTRIPAVIRLEVPMLAIAAAISPPLATWYSILLFIEVYTTAVASLYGFVARLRPQRDRVFTWFTLGASLTAFFAARFGFSKIVGTLFPAVGLAGLLMLVALAWYRLPQKWREPFTRLAPAAATKDLMGKLSYETGEELDPREKTDH